MANTTKKRRQLSIETKLQILESVDTGEKKTAIAERFNIPASTLSTIIANRHKMGNGIEKFGPERKRSRSCKNDELDRKVFEWFTEVRSANIPLSGSILQDRAKTIALKLGIDDFHASNGWLSRFKRRWNLTTLRVCGEEAAVDVAVVEEWKKNLPSLVAGYDPKDIFNADESGFFYNLLPDSTLATKGEICHGGKRSKERLTVLFCTNSDGSEKLKPFVIGKFASPRCFKHVKKLPCRYGNNKSAWMTAILFREWLASLDAVMGGKNRKILLFLDGCTAHKTSDMKLRNVKVVHFPPNCTSKVQPLDQGIISLVKRAYRRQLVEYLLPRIGNTEDIKSLKWNILQAIQRLCVAWDGVEKSAITNCFRRAGFPGEMDVQDDPQPEEREEWGEVAQLLNIEGVSFEDFANIDDDLAVFGKNEDPEIITETQDVSDEEREESSNCVVRPSWKEVVDAVDVLERVFITSEDGIENLKILRQVEQAASKEMRKRMRQTTLQNYFK
ncbi:tigger transposable element-derived protein 6-like [Ischnura elegans]|uniref:tigger transposable element-derived protein 6-like n=2 Tax=Ischnura elegans TaxID=197161 RepID=UPI001ED86E9B|nr:tigger transposable element-derived protein 6-like [Ischnura elegans]